MAEIALRCGRGLEMTTRSSGTLRLLIEICARSLVADVSAGCSTGPLAAPGRRTETRVTVARDRAWSGIDVGKTHHWACVVDADGRTMLSVKVANDETDIVAFIKRVETLADQ